MAFTKKIAGWVAGRIKGEKARKDTMRWMEKTGLGQILDIAGDIALTTGAVKGAGALKGGLKGLFGVKEAAQGGSTLAQYGNLPTSLPPVAGGGAPTPIASQVSASLRAPTGGMGLPPTGGIPTPIAGQVSAGLRAPAAGAMGLPAAGGAAPTPIAGQVASAARPMMAPPTPVAQQVSASMAPSPVQAMVAPKTPTALGAQQATRVVSAPPLKPLGPMGGTSTTVAPRVPAAPRMTPPSAPTTMPTTAAPSTMQRLLATKPGQAATALGRGAMATGRFAKENVEPLAYGASALTDYFANRRRTDLEEQQMELEQERRNRLAQLLMPMFQAEVQRYGQSTRG